MTKKMYSLHMRKNIIKIKTNEKLSIREAGRRFGISTNTVYKWGKKIEPKEWRKSVFVYRQKCILLFGT